MQVEHRKGDWIQTFSNLQFFPLDARVEDIHLIDIAHALSNLCRFGGHCDRFYSVAQHSVLVSEHVPREHAVAALLHDATEAYLIDVPRPIKAHLGGYREIEHGLAVVIGRRFGVCLEPLPDVVKEHDDRALWTEKRDLRGPSPVSWTSSPNAPPAREPWPEIVHPWSQEMARRSFLARAADLGIK